MLLQVIKIGLWAIQHEDEILAKLPPEKHPQIILAIAKMKQGIDNLRKFVEEVEGN